MTARCGTRSSRRTEIAGPLFIGFGLCLFALVDGSAAAKTNDPVIAQVGQETITATSFARALAILPPETRRKAADDRKVLLDLVRTELGRQAVLAQAHAQHWDKRPDVAARADHARDDVVITSFLSTQITPPTSFPDEAAVRQVYEANLSRFMMPRQYHVAQIYIARPAGGKPEDIARARVRVETLADTAHKTGTDFATLATKSSDDHDSAAHGGDLGWVAEKQLVPEIAHSLVGLGDNEISDPVAVADGWHILHLIGTRPPSPEPLEQARATIVALLRDQESARLGQAYVSDLLSRGHAEVDLEAVKALLTKEP